MIKKNYTIPRMKKDDLWRNGPWAESINIGSSEGGMGYVFVHRNLVSSAIVGCKVPRSSCVSFLKLSSTIAIFIGNMGLIVVTIV